MQKCVWPNVLVQNAEDWTFCPLLQASRNAVICMFVVEFAGLCILQVTRICP